MTDRRPDDPDDGVVYLDEGDGREDVARALEEAERAVSAVAERHKKHDDPPRDEKGFRVDDKPAAERITELVLQLEEERERALKAE